MKKLLIISVLALVGCKTDLAQFSVMCPRSIDMSKAEYTVDRTKKVRGVSGSALYIVYAPDAPSYDAAVKNAMSKRSGCVGIADLKLRREAFWLLFGYCDFIAEGYPIIKKEAK